MEVVIALASVVRSAVCHPRQARSRNRQLPKPPNRLQLAPGNLITNFTQRTAALSRSSPASVGPVARISDVPDARRALIGHAQRAPTEVPRPGTSVTSVITSVSYACRTARPHNGRPRTHRTRPRDTRPSAPPLEQVVHRVGSPTHPNGPFLPLDNGAPTRESRS